MAIDLHHLARATNGDAALQQELLVLFRGQLNELRESLEMGMATSPSHDVLPLLHRTRGAAQAIGAAALATCLKRAEAGVSPAEPAGVAAEVLAALATCLDSTAADVDRLVATGGGAGLAKTGESG